MDEDGLELIECPNLVAIVEMNREFLDDFGFSPKKARELSAEGRESDSLAYMEEFIRLGSVRARISMADYLFDKGELDASLAWIDKVENAIADDDFISPAYLASAYLRGLGRGERSEREQKALALYERVAEAGNLPVMLMLMSNYQHGLNGASQSREKFLFWAKRAAALGSREAANAIEQGLSARAPIGREEKNSDFSRSE